MNCDAGHFKNPGALVRLKISGANVRGDDWHREASVRTEGGCPSPSQVGEDEVAPGRRGAGRLGPSCGDGEEHGWPVRELGAAMRAPVQAPTRTKRGSRGADRDTR